MSWWKAIIITYVSVLGGQLVVFYMILKVSANCISFFKTNAVSLINLSFFLNY